MSPLGSSTSARALTPSIDDTVPIGDHWPVVLSLALAGGGLRHGQVIGATERDGGNIKERPVTPGDLAATIYRHFGVPLDSTYADVAGRVLNLLPHGGEPVRAFVTDTLPLRFRHLS